MTPGVLWEITLGSWLTAALLLLARVLPMRCLRPRWRARLWLLLALRLLPVQLLPFPMIPLQSPVSLLRYAPDLEKTAAVLAPRGETAGAAASGPVITGLWPVLRTVWLAGAGAVLLVYLLLYLAARRRLRRLPPCTDLETEREYLRLKQRLRPGFNPRLVQGDQGMLGGFFRPTLVIPADRLGKWAAPIMLHELMHYQAGDLWFGLLFRLLCAVYWFNPLLWLCFRLMCRDEELACDERVLDAGLVSPTDYANTLLEEYRLRGRPDPMPLARFGAAGIKRRVRVVLDYRKSGGGSAAIPVLLALAVLAFAALSPYTGRSYGFDRSIPAQVGYPNTESYICALQTAYGAFGMTHGRLVAAGYLAEGEGVWDRTAPDGSVLSVRRELGGMELTLQLIFRPTLFSSAAGTAVLTEIRAIVPPLDLNTEWQSWAIGRAMRESCPALEECPAMYSGTYTDLLDGKARQEWGILDRMDTAEEAEAHRALSLASPFGRSYTVFCTPVTLGDCLSAEEAEALAGLAVEAGMARNLKEGRSLVQSWHLCGLLGSNYCDSWRLMGMGVALYETRPGTAGG